MLSNCGVGEDSWESLRPEEIKPVNHKGNEPWIFIGRTDAEAPILWPPDVKSWLRKDPDAGIEGRRKSRQQRTIWLDGITNSSLHEFEQALGDGKGQGSLAWCSPWGCKESDTQGNGYYQYAAGGKARWLGFAPRHLNFPRNQWFKEEILRPKRWYAHIIRIGT